MDTIESMPWLTGAAAASPSFDWSGVTTGMFGLADTWLKADTAIKLQKANNGYYLEGQRTPGRQSGALSIPTDLLVIGGLAALFFLAMD